MLKAFDDFMSPKVLAISLISLLITILLIFIIFLTFYDYSGEITKLVPTIFTNAMHTLQKKIETYPFLSFVLEHKLLMIMYRFLIYFGIGIVIYYMFLVTYGFIVSLFNQSLMKYIQKKYYTDIELKGMSFITSVFFYIKTIVITLILFIVISPLYFIPVVNILFFLPFYYFFHKTIVFDVSSVINTFKEYKKIKQANWSELKARTGFCFLLSFIPVLGILLYPYYVLYLGHYIMKETRELRYIDEFRKN
jgi:hypothetical protein